MTPRSPPLKTLRAEAMDAAAALGMEIDRFQSVRLDEGSRPIPMSARMNAASAMAGPMSPPRATREQQDITAAVSADVVLHPAPTERNPNP